MARQITLDTLTPLGINIFKESGRLKVEANYQLQAGTEVIKTISRDITSYLPSTLQDNISTAYDSVFNNLEQAELS